MMRPTALPGTLGRAPGTLQQGGIMWWGIGIGAGILYLVLLFTLGFMTLKNHHGWMFFFGIFFPILWIFGAFMSPPERVVQA
jgi:hypothetical protein